MLCLGLKKSLTSPRLELAGQGVAFRCSKVECEDHSAIQAPNLTGDMKIEISRFDNAELNKLAQIIIKN